MWKDIVVTVCAFMLSLGFVILMGLNVEACEKDKCTIRYDQWMACKEKHWDKGCRDIKRIMNAVCLEEK